MLQAFHTGLVVDDLDEAMARMTKSLGHRWRPVLEGHDVEMWTPSGLVSVDFRRVYSLDGPPYVELIEERTGLVWGPGRPGGDHHIGYWCSDLRSAVADAEARGMRRCVGDPGLERAAYLQGATGPIVELLPRSRRSQILPAIAVVVNV